MKEQTLRKQVKYWEEQYHANKTSPLTPQCADMCLIILQEKRKQIKMLESNTNSFLKRLVTSLRLYTLEHSKPYYVNHNQELPLWWNSEKHQFEFRNGTPFLDTQEIYHVEPITIRTVQPC